MPSFTEGQFPHLRCAQASVRAAHAGPEAAGRGGQPRPQRLMRRRTSPAEAAGHSARCSGGRCARFRLEFVGCNPLSVFTGFGHEDRRRLCTQRTRRASPHAVAFRACKVEASITLTLLTAGAGGGRCGRRAAILRPMEARGARSGGVRVAREPSQAAMTGRTCSTRGRGCRGACPSTSSCSSSRCGGA